jgi:hypothetical protein
MQVGISLTGNRRAGGFSPNALFAASEAGDWFDPSDLSRMFTNTTGATPVTADGQTVALMLGQRRGANVELAGGFSYEALAGTVPTPPAGGFVIRRSVDGTQNWILRLIGLTIGRVYRITFTAANDALEAGNTAAILAVQLGGIENVHAVGGAGTYTVFYSPTLANDGGGSIRFQCAAGNSVVVSNISVKEVALTALTQSDAAKRPAYKTSGGLHWLLFDGTNDALASAATLNLTGTDATLAYVDDSGVTILAGQTISGTVTLPSSTSLRGVLYLDRALTAAERANLIRFWGDPYADVYVDSVNGSNSYDGLSSGRALQTLSAASSAMSAGKSISLARASMWREQFEVDWDNITVGVHGAGDPPVISAADIVAATWTQPDAVTYPDVWSISWTRGHTPTATDQLLLWADDVLQVHQPSLAALQANGGWRADNRVATTTNVYIKSTVDPNSSGVVYELPKRKQAITGHDQLADGPGDFATIIGPIEALRSSQNYGPVAGGSGSQSRLLLRDGGLHHIVSEAASGSDIVIAGVDPNFPNSTAPFTAYRATSTGFRPSWARIIVLGGGNIATGGSGIYAHASSPSPLTESFNVSQSYVDNMQVGLTVNTQDLTVRGLYTKDCGQSVGISATSSTVTHSLTSVSTSTAGRRAFYDSGVVNTDVKSRLIENCAIYSSDVARVHGLAEAQSRNGTLTIRNCIIFIEPTSATVQSLIFANAAPSGALHIISEYNIFVKLETSATGVFYTYDLLSPVTIESDHNIWIGRTNVDCRLAGTNYNTLAAWKAQGYDLNSVQPYTGNNRATVLSTFFQGDPANGDFRLKPGLGTFTDGVSMNLAGPQEHWDWNARGIASGASPAWPTPPLSLPEARTYINNPAAWDFYP